MTRTPSTKQSELTRRDAIRAGIGFLGAFAMSPGIQQSVQAADQPNTAMPVPADAAPQLKSESLGNSLALISGAGGNIAVLGGADGTLVIDSGLAPVAIATAGEITKIAPGPLAMLVNTHWHFDHAGGNERLAKGGAKIVAHENCRKRLSVDQYNEFFDRTFPASPASALPLLTLTNDTTLHLNGEEIRLIPVPPAHTDSDLIVRFEKANLVHTGDLFFNGAYPFIDASSGGWIGGMIVAAKRILNLSDAKTRIIPGHGPVASQEDLKAYIAFLETVSERLTKLKAAGKTVEEAIAEAPTKEFDAKLGGGFFNSEQFVTFAYKGLLKRP